MPSNCSPLIYSSILPVTEQHVVSLKLFVKISAPPPPFGLPLFLPACETISSRPRVWLTLSTSTSSEPWEVQQ